MRPLVLALLAWSAPAAADALAPTTVQAELAGDSVAITARYRASTGQSYAITLPAGGVVIGATVTANGARHALALDAASTVEATVSAAFATNYEQGDLWFARVRGGKSGWVTLDVYGPRATPVAVELQIVAPPCVRHDTRRVMVPSAWATKVRGTKVVRGIEGCTSNVDETLLVFPAPAERVAIAASSVALDGARQLARVQVALANAIEDLPADLATVILVDESLSLTAAQRTAQRALVAGYLRAAPTSRVQVHGYARATRPIAGRWGTARTLARSIDRALATLPQRNGSNIDAALTEAGRILAATRGTRRVVLITDAALATSLATNVARHAKLLPADVVLHVAAVTADSESQVLRYDAALLAPLAAATGGIAVHASADREPLDVMPLIRPSSLDNVQLRAPGWTLHSECSTDIAAGTTCEWWATGPRGQQPFTVEGQLWQRRFSRTVQPAERSDLAREVLGRALDLGVAVDARAVSPGSQLFVRWGGQRPLHGGVVEPAPTPQHWDYIVSDRAQRSPKPATLDPTAQITVLAKQCAITPGSTVTVELTFTEVVAVRATGSTCLEEAVWNHRFVGASTEPSREFTIRL